MSLADLLKADLEDLEEQDENLYEDGDDKMKNEDDEDQMDGLEEVGLTNNNETDNFKKIFNSVRMNLDSVKSIAKLLDSDRLNRIMSQIKTYQSCPIRTSIVGPVEQDAEYQLIVEANNLTVEIDSEINVIHKFIRDKYAKRFPELESLVINPMDYTRAVRELGNNVHLAKHNEELLKFLTTATIMIVSVSASTTQGTNLNESQLNYVNEACDTAIRLNDIKAQIFEYVESRMTFIAPNLSIIAGAPTAAKIIGIAGGLTNLSKMPACNILLLGQQKKALSGFSTVQVIPHTGFVYHSEIVQKVPEEYRKQVSRILAGKMTLAARIDSAHESRNGKLGSDLRDQVDSRIEKLLAPPPVKLNKPLIPPIEQARPKRGGKRARANKQRNGMTEMHKQANRMTFGQIDEDAYQDDLNFSTGQLGKSGSGRVRAAQVDSKTKARISKTLQKTISKQNNWGGASTVRRNMISGTASSVAFSSIQGLEIVNQNAMEKNTKGTESQKYFSASSGFSRVSSVIPKI